MSTIVTVILWSNFLIIPIYSQELHHQMFASIVGNRTTKSGYVVTQSIGQLSVGATFSSVSMVVQQGFQQSEKFKRIEAVTRNNLITTTVYPNPVIDYVVFKFSEPIKGKITILLFDMSGKLILTQDQIDSSYTQVILGSLSSMPAGSYIVQVKSPNYKYLTKIIKRK